MTIRHASLLLSLSLAACDGGSSKDDTGAAGSEESDCQPWEPQDSSWDITDSIDNIGAVDAHTITPPTTRGDGIMRATMTFGKYDGSPRLSLLADSGDQFSTASVHAGDPAAADYATTIFLEWSMATDDSVELQVDEFLASATEGDYPIDYTLTLSWQDRVDCWEDNDTAAQAARMPIDATHEAWLLGTPASDSTLRDVGEEDWYRVEIPQDAAGLSVALTPPSDITVQIEAFSDQGVTAIGSVAGYEGGESVSLDLDASGTVYLKVSDTFGIEAAWGEPSEDTAEFAYLNEPYTITLSQR